MDRRLIFLHIEKTAGTSLLRSVLQPNLTCHQVGPIRTVRSHADAECLYGHIPYGYGVVCPGTSTTRPCSSEPVDRAVSYYYFIKDLVRVDLVERHEHRDYADSVTVAQFFENPRFANIQTRRIAGIEFDKTYPLAHRSRRFTTAMLDAAKRHLEAMPVFGVQSRYEESQKRFLDYIGRGRIEPTEKENRTRKRPTLEEIAELRPSAIDRLAAAHQLDTELFRFASELFGEGPRPPAHGWSAGE